VLKQGNIAYPMMAKDAINHATPQTFIPPVVRRLAATDSADRLSSVPPLPLSSFPGYLAEKSIVKKDIGEDNKTSRKRKMSSGDHVLASTPKRSKVGDLSTKLLNGIRRRITQTLKTSPIAKVFSPPRCAPGKPPDLLHSPIYPQFQPNTRRVIARQ
jgi:hypothetical protein